MTDLPRPPVALNKAGRALWRSVLGRYELEEHERVVLVQACQTVDLCADLQVILDRDGPIVLEGERTKANPAAVELRQHRIVMARLIAALRIPLEDSTDRTQARSLRGVYGGPVSAA